MKVSIITPCYNAAPYIETTIASIQQQTLSDWEMIIVDDGSTDGSGALCDGIARQDPRVTVIHQKNAGVSAARNAGLAAATGVSISSGTKLGAAGFAGAAAGRAAALGAKLT